MKHWVYFTIAIIAAIAVFLRVWATAPEHEKRQQELAELQTLTANYTLARREIYSLFHNADYDPAVLEDYFDRLPADLVARTGAAVTLRGVGAQILFERGRDEHAKSLFRQVADATPQITRSRADRMPLPGRVATARALAEAGRTDEARVIAASCQAWVDDRTTVQIQREQGVPVFSDLGWVWSRLGEPEQALANWQRLLDLHEGENVPAYNMACYTALVGDRQRALEYIALAVDQWRVDARRAFFTLDLFDNDPDLDSIRDAPDFIAAREQLVRKIGEREAYLEEFRSRADESDPLGPDAPGGPDQSEPVP